MVPNPSKHRQSKILVSLGNAIRDTRLARNMSQEELSLKADVDMSYVGRVERGDNNVAVITLQKLAVALDVTLAELMANAEL